MLSTEKFTQFIQQNALFYPEERVLLALSGGKDSVLMAHLYKAAGYRFGLAHANFGLRAAESDEDERFCEELAKQLDVPFYSTRFQTEAYAQAEQLSIQMAARELRYQWLEHLRQSEGYHYVAVAHHQNDSVETILLNLVRGTGVSGLHGILPKRDFLIRPLLYLKREDVDALVAQEGFLFQEDSSNQSVKYARNKLRHEVVPVLKELNPSLEHTFEQNARRMAELEALLHQHVAELHAQLFETTADGTLRIALAPLKTLLPQKTLLFELFKPYGFTESVLADLCASWNGHAGKVFQSATHELLLDRDCLYLSSALSTSPLATTVQSNQTEISWNKQHYTVQNIDIADFVLEKTNQKAQLNADLLVYPLVLRSWQVGDCYQPLGMQGQKKLSDLFIEHKIPRNQKDSTLVLQNGNGDILWVAGMRIHERYKVDSNTKKVLILAPNA
ncbi:MAG: tRNA lysidine(34) synthetase TilS [Sphingobacteriales bacterium]|nr:tRNA lysidine(34) synthetase TilS [Sphingobacteriales bacterium]